MARRPKKQEPPPPPKLAPLRVSVWRSVARAADNAAHKTYNDDLKRERLSNAAGYIERTTKGLAPKELVSLSPSAATICELARLTDIPLDAANAFRESIWPLLCDGAVDVEPVKLSADELAEMRALADDETHSLIEPEVGDLEPATN